MYLVGIAGRAYYNKDGQKIIQTHEATRKLLMSDDEIVCITLLPVENKDYVDMEIGSDTLDTKKLDYILDKCDAFIIPGGTYGYRFDEYIIDYAIKNDKPLLAICLGFQIMTSMFAKDRNKFDMTEKGDSSLHHNNPIEYSHKVSIQENTLLKRILHKDSIPVNSVHNDIVNFSFDTLVVNALSEDGVIEGVEYPGKKFILGLQWHPEYLMDEYNSEIINTFIAAIKESCDRNAEL